MADNLIVTIMGPTCVGKTELAIDLFGKFPIKIISVDSVQIYKKLNIGSGKPNETILKEFPHDLVNIIEPSEPYSTAKFQTDCIKVIQKAYSEGQIPLLVGGTMMYFHHLVHGLSNIPQTKKSTRDFVEKKFQSQGLEKMYSYLKEIDEETANRLHPNDSQRIKRAVEVFEETGKQISAFQKENSSQVHPIISESSILQIALQPKDIDSHKNQIASRFRTMIKDGLVEEVENILKIEGMKTDSQSLKSVGYRQVCEFLGNEIEHDVMIDKAINSTRQLSKRQMTWLKSWKDVVYLENDSNLLDNVEGLIKRNK